MRLTRAMHINKDQSKLSSTTTTEGEGRGKEHRKHIATKFTTISCENNDKTCGQLHAFKITLSRHFIAHTFAHTQEYKQTLL